jgi:hypothetical protein
MRSAIWRQLARFATTIALLGAVLSGESASAQQPSLINPSDAQMRRELRSLEGQVGSSALGTDLQLQRARRDLVSRSRGVALTPEAARIDRGLDQVGRDLQRQDLDAAQPTAPSPPRAEPLPTSYREGVPLPSIDAATTVGRLLGRAEQAIGEGRAAQARSDLATAHSLMTGLDASAPVAAALQTRITAVEARLDGSGG